MAKHHPKKTILTDGSKVSVVGGGPAGSFFAIHLLRAAKQLHRNIDVTIIDVKGESSLKTSPKMLKGCNYCAGVISPGMHELMADSDIMVPRELICETFTHVWIHGLWKNFPFRVPPEQKMYSVFRGSLPPGSQNATGGFDNFLLQQATKEGAILTAGETRSIRYSLDNKPLLTVKALSGETYDIESDFAVIATGVNSGTPSAPSCPKTSLFRSYRHINPLFRPPKVRRTLIFELKPGRAYLEKYMNKELYFIESGSARLQLEHAALVPKGDYLTVALVGESAEKESTPEKSRQIIRAFLALPHIRATLPHLDSPALKISCTCSPYMAVKPAKAPYSDRIALVGDALGARLYKDGLYSAFISARTLADTVIHKGVDGESLSLGYDRVAKWLEKDNHYGNLVFGLIRSAFRFPHLSRIFYQAFATEMKFSGRDQWFLGNLLWKIGSGSTGYRAIIREFFSAPVLRSIITGIKKTARNILTELFFGISWKTVGRYPTVILKEKRDYFKKSIAAPPGLLPDVPPEMERMYAIKVRASAEGIYRELGRFGEPGSKFLRLRFLDVKRISGEANQVGAIVSYRLKHSPVRMDLRLAHAVPNKMVLYKPGELFATGGKLLFDIAPASDGNNRLFIYTGFDFRKGKGVFSKLFWKLFKKIFPDFAHDVVWNHAICSIKGEAERRERSLE